MKTSLQLNLGQQLTLTPQLQQAIRLLQLSTLDLNQEIQQTLEENPLLELETPADTIATKTKLQTADMGLQETPMDSVWDDLYPSLSYKHQNELPNIDNTYGTENTLHDYLRWQMELTPFSDTDRAIATALIDAIDDAGFLTTSLDDIHHSFTDQTSAESPIELDEITAVLHRIQQFDPPGVGAHDLQECLYLQLQQLPEHTPWLSQARRLVKHYLTLLCQHHYKQLMRKLRVSHAELVDILALIRSLHPCPGEKIFSQKPEYIIPDVIVKKVAGQWHVELNPDAVPKLRIHQGYAGLIKRANNTPDNQFLKTHLQDARWFIKSIQSRHQTLLNVARCIVERQQAFFEHGDEAMKPMILHHIADTLGLHESTISRITTQKYIHTPRGVFELKYFFSSYINTESGGECSSTAIRAVIKKLLAAENPANPLSDNKIAQLLNQKGINIARRTIAKYREAMHIPPSNERKSLSNP